jgi:hypothetical protein
LLSLSITLGLEGLFFLVLVLVLARTLGKGQRPKKARFLFFALDAGSGCFFFLLLPAMPALVLFLVDEVTLRLLAD